jgi:hypothetical protein
MRIHNLYADEAGASHFRDVDIAMPEETPIGSLSALVPAIGLIFRKTKGSYDVGWHNAPRRQYIINLDAAVRVTASDGESRIIGAGEVLLIEDVTGVGHQSQAVDGKDRHSIFVPID